MFEARARQAPDAHFGTFRHCLEAVSDTEVGGARLPSLTATSSPPEALGASDTRSSLDRLARGCCLAIDVGNTQPSSGYSTASS